MHFWIGVRREMRCMLIVDAGGSEGGAERSTEGVEVDGQGGLGFVVERIMWRRYPRDDRARVGPSSRSEFPHFFDWLQPEDTGHDEAIAQSFGKLRA